MDQTSPSFQSLSGFPMSCNTKVSAMAGCFPVFQSLSGFPMSCNNESLGHRGTLTSVSIPIGFSNELQQPSDVHRRLRSLVSIPIGFSNELQQEWLELWLRCQDEFQSLSGFPMSCNRLGRCLMLSRQTVSIPIGFSNELQQPPFSGLIGIVPAFLPQIGAMCSWAPSVPDLYKYP